ncbi:MAG: 4-hydroxy-tetrahydrodipicolinate synthase [Chlorobi bacterium]|nr:4-hydroxy-tetrahydrodipicolinate synthase [Chlorobiota bacterium]
MDIKNLKGAIVAIVTPFNEDGSIDFESFDMLIDFHLDKGTDGIVVCGTTGEAATMTKEEDVMVIGRAVERINGRIPVIAGTGSNNTRDAIEYTKKAKEIGVDAALVVGPYYNKPTAKGMYLHFSNIAKAVDIPIILYNVPSRTGSSIPVDIALQLGNDFDNIIGIKEASGSLSVAAELIARRRDGFKVFSGDDFLSSAMNFLGADGCISVIANVVPEGFRQMMHASLGGDAEKTRELFYKYRKLMNILFIESNPIPVKTALALMGMIKEAFRSPMCPMEDVNRDKLIAELKELGLV